MSLKFRYLKQQTQVLVILLLLTVHVSYAQRALTEADIAANTQYFKLAEGFAGKGGDFLNDEISKSQFIAFGELHNSKQVALFSDALLKESIKYGFDRLALEVGPNAGKIISGLIANATEAKDNLRAFHQQYNSRSNSWAIPFIRGEEDAEFLSTASTLKYKLYGIDQEYTLGALALFDELFKQLPSTDNEAAQLKEAAAKAWRKAKAKTRHCDALASKEIDAYFQLFDENNSRALEIIGDLKTSWEIYCHYDKKEYGLNNKKRVAYMRSNFDKILESGGGTQPKVIAKMGSVHMGRIKSTMGLQDVGHLMSIRAKESGKASLHIRYLRRYWMGKDKVDSKDYSNSRIFLTVGKRDEWAVIDLRPLREKIRNKELTATDWQKFEIFNYDLMLMAPEDRWVKNNF